MATKKSSTAEARQILTMDEYDRITLELCHVESLCDLFHHRVYGAETADMTDQSLVTFLEERVGKIREVLQKAVAHG